MTDRLRRLLRCPAITAEGVRCGLTRHTRRKRHVGTNLAPVSAPTGTKTAMWATYWWEAERD